MSPFPSLVPAAAAAPAEDAPASAAVVDAEQLRQMKEDAARAGPVPTPQPPPVTRGESQPPGVLANPLNEHQEHPPVDRSNDVAVGSSCVLCESEGEMSDEDIPSGGGGDVHAAHPYACPPSPTPGAAVSPALQGRATNTTGPRGAACRQTPVIASLPSGALSPTQGGFGEVLNGRLDGWSAAAQAAAGGPRRPPPRVVSPESPFVEVPRGRPASAPRGARAGSRPSTPTARTPPTPLRTPRGKLQHPQQRSSTSSGPVVAGAAGRERADSNLSREQLQEAALAAALNKMCPCRIKAGDCKKCGPPIRARAAARAASNCNSSSRAASSIGSSDRDISRFVPPIIKVKDRRYQTADTYRIPSDLGGQPFSELVEHLAKTYAADPQCLTLTIRTKKAGVLEWYHNDLVYTVPPKAAWSLDVRCADNAKSAKDDGGCCIVM